MAASSSTIRARLHRWRPARILARMSDAGVDHAILLAVQHHRAGRLAEAEAIYRQILARYPRHAKTLNLLGVLAYQAGKPAIAADLQQRAIAIDDRAANYHNDLGIAFTALGRNLDAMRAYERAIGLDPNMAEAHANLANSYRVANRKDDAIAAFQRSLHIKPEAASTYNDLGNLLQELGRLDDAVAAFQQALKLQPDLAEAHNGLGIALVRSRKFAEAESAFKEAVKSRPRYALALSNLGIVLRLQGQLDDAAAACNDALVIDPNCVSAGTNLADIMSQQGDSDRAIELLRQAVALLPENAEYHSSLLFALHFSDSSTPQSILKEHRLYAQRHANRFRSQIAPHSNDRDPDRRLRVGYVAPYFCNHCQSLLTIPLLSNHDHQRFEIFCYSDTSPEDNVTDRIRGLADHWRQTHGMPDEHLAQQIRVDQIDILVDLVLHLGGGRPLVFARQPAPVQVTWLGCPTTTGVPAITYRLTDPFLDPPGTNDEFYVEKSIRLPETFWCYDPLSDGPDIGSLPAKRNGYVTFGSLNNFRKVTGRTLELWSRVLLGVPDSQMLILCNGSTGRERVLCAFENAGVAPPESSSSRSSRERTILGLTTRLTLCSTQFHATATRRRLMRSGWVFLLWASREQRGYRAAD